MHFLMRIFQIFCPGVAIMFALMLLAYVLPLIFYDLDLYASPTPNNRFVPPLHTLRIHSAKQPSRCIP